MMSCYLRALRLSPSALSATVVNAAANFACSALLGRALFDEDLSLQWWSGFSLIVGGVYCVHRASADGAEPRAKAQ